MVVRYARGIYRILYGCHFRGHHFARVTVRILGVVVVVFGHLHNMHAPPVSGGAPVKAATTPPARLPPRHLTVTFAILTR